MTERERAGGSPRLVGLLFFLSGASSLGFEVVWAKQLGIVLGGTTTGIAFVVALFMGGMALGYAAGGQLAPRVRRPIAAYGLCEIILALLALLAAYLSPSLEGITPQALAYLLATLLLLPCTFLMGLTLPLLVDGTRGSVGGAIGTLYGLNTLGAVLGVIMTGMLLIGLYGLIGSAWILTCAGVAVGLVALWVGREARKPAGSPDPVSTLQESKKEPTDASLAPRWAALALTVGFVSLAEEVLWTRALIPQLNSSTYAFSAILAVFLLGLALGAGVSGRMVARGKDPITWLAGTQLLAGFFVLFSPEALVLAEHALPGYVGIRQVGETALWLSVMGTALLRACLALLLPAIMLGFALPLLADLYARALGSRTQAIGKLASFNTVGSVAGSLAARFALLPLLGVSGALRALALVHALIAFFAAFRQARAHIWIALPFGLALMAVLRPNAATPLGRLVEGHKLLFLDEGVQDTTAVVDIHSKFERGRQIVSNGIAYAGDMPSAQRYMRMLGHLPALHAREQRRALVICLGTGMTAAAVARHPAFETLDLVDISPVVFQTLPLFARSNDRVYEQPRSHIHIEDGRVFLAHAPAGHYDVITLEPPPPRAAGVAALYSRDFYLHAQRALADGGALAQWLPVHGMTNDELRMLARTFTEVFPDAIMYEVQHVEAALIAVKGKGASEDEIARRLAVPSVAAHLAALGIPSPVALPSIRGHSLRVALGEGPIVTDDKPRIEHFAAGLPSQGGATDGAGQDFLDQMLGAQRQAVAPH